MSAFRWPKLSETLAERRHPDLCQRCGRDHDVSPWQEHDDHDGPTPVVVVLCLWCSEAVIEKHPRLYRELERNEPFPGVMPLCVDCEQREGVRCMSPALKANGGDGLETIGPRPVTVHFDGTKGGRRWGCTVRTWPGRVQECAGRSVATIEIARRRAD